MENRFDNASDIQEVLGQLAGAASVCWDPRPTGVFDSELASEFLDEALARIVTLLEAEGQKLP